MTSLSSIRAVSNLSSIRAVSKAVPLIAALSMLAAPALLTPVAFADPDATCTTPVLDETKDQVLDLGAVRDAVRSVDEATGADVYVRAFQSTPGGDGAAWWRQTYTSCPGWLGADGKTPKPNILVVEFGLDHTSAIEYGSNFHKLDSSIDGIRSKKLGSALRSGKYTQAVTDTLGALDTAITAAPPPPPAPTNLSGLWTAFKWLGASILVLALALFSPAMFRFGKGHVLSWIEARRELRETRRKYLRAQYLASKSVLEADLSKELVRTSTALSAADPGHNLPELDDLQDRINELSGEYTALSGFPTPTALSRLKSGVEQFGAVSRGIGDALDEARRRAEKAEEYAQSCTVDSKKASLAEVRTLLDEAVRDFDEKTPEWADMSSARELLTSSSSKADALTTMLDDPSAHPTETSRPAVNRMISSATSAVERVRAQREHAQDEESRFADAIDDVKRQALLFSTRVDDVLESTRKATRTRLESLLSVSEARIRDLHGMKDSGRTIPVSELSDTTNSLVVSLRDARKDATSQIERARAARQAEERRQAEKERQERERAAEERRRRRREEEESRSRSYSRGDSSFGYGMAAGYALGSSNSSSSSSDFGGGFSSGSDFGGSDFGGGSSGDW